jgi:hypothetical protein
VSLKHLTTGLAAATLVGAAAVGVTSIASAPTTATPAIVPVVFGAPLPQDNGADVPTTDDLMTVLNGLADPSVPFRSKSNLVEGGVGIIEGRTADHLMASAVQNGDLPLSFQVANIQPSGPAAATATVTASGPRTQPTAQTVTFVDQGGWKLSRGSATSLLQSFSGSS